MSAPNLTSADFGSGTRFAAIQSQIAPTALDQINRSERLKELIRVYQADDTRRADRRGNPQVGPAARMTPGETSAAELTVLRRAS